MARRERVKYTKKVNQKNRRFFWFKDRRRVVGDAGLEETQIGNKPVAENKWACVDISSAGFNDKRTPNHNDDHYEDDHYEDDYIDQRYDFNDFSEDDNEYSPEPKKPTKGFIARVGSLGVTMLGYISALRMIGARFLVVLAGVFVAGVVLENQLQFLGLFADLWAIGSLTVIQWLNPSSHLVPLVFTGLLMVVGLWLLRSIVQHLSMISSGGKHAKISREMLDRHQ